jgi:NADH-quinone oxidoreductase subunit C
MSDETATPEDATAAVADDTGAQPDAQPDAAQPDTSTVANTELLAHVETALGTGAVVESGEAFGDLIVRIAPDRWLDAARVCREQLGFDYLSFVSAIDWMPAPTLAEEGSGDTSAPVQPREQTFGIAGSAGRFQVFARVASTHTPRSGLTLKTDVDDVEPRVASWVPVYPGADWHERECWEMFGITFDGHPSLRHLYLPSEFEGHPLRKDFALLAREVKPWPGLVDVEPMPGEPAADDDGGEA